MRRALSTCLLSSLILLCFGATSRGQTSTFRTDRIGIGGNAPDATAAISVDPADVPAKTTGHDLVFMTPAGLFNKGVLAKGDLPSVTVFTDQANTFGAFLQTFGSAGLTSNGNITITGTNDLITGTGGIRTSSGAVEIRNIADTLIIASFGDAAIALNQPTTLTGLTTFAGAIRGSASPLIIRNSGNTLDVVSIADLGTSITGTLAVGGLTTATGGLKATKIFGTSNPLLFRNAADTLNIITMADNLVTIAQPTTVQGDVTITSAFDLITGTGGIRTSTGTVDIRNIADSATTAAFGDAAITFNQPTTINAALNVTGLTTAAAIKATSYRAVASPFTVLASDGVTTLMTMTDAGLNRITNTGNDTVWEYNAGGNPSGQRLWRAGNIGGSYLIQGGNDAGSTWTNIFRTTQTAGVPDGWFWGTGVKDVNPDLASQTNLGAINKPYANLHVDNLWAGTLVAYDTITTIPGNVLVGPTTMLTADIASGATTMTVEHNEMASGDVVYMQEALAKEFLLVGSGAAGVSVVSSIGGGQSQLTTVTIPAHQVGDLILIYAFASTAVVPTMGIAGGTSVCSGSGGTTGYRIGAKIAASTGETSGTWTSATHMQVRVYRASVGAMVIPSTCAASANAGATTTLTYPALTALNTSQGSWIGRAGYSTTATNVEQVPAGFTLRAANGGGPEMATFDTNGGVASVAAASITLNVSGAVRALTVEISAPTIGPYSYTMTRGYGGVHPARAWLDGDVIFNTGNVGDCHLQMYAIQSIKGTGENGPTVQGNCRTTTTYNGWSTNWALGNLRNHYTYGATDVFGAAFGNAADVWLGIDATNGIRFFEGATTQTALFALDGSILLGQTGAGQYNTFINNTNLLLRAGSVERVNINASALLLNDIAGATKVTLDNSQLLMGTTGAGEENLQITATAINLRQATTNRVVLDSTSLRFYDTGGVNYPMEMGAAFTRLGYGHTSAFNHVYADNTGNLSFGSTSQTRIHIASSNGAMTFRDTAGTTRVTLDSSGALLGLTTAGHGNILLDTTGNASFRSGTVTRIKIDASNGGLRFNDTAGTQRMFVGDLGAGVNGIVVGRNSTAGDPHIVVRPTTMEFCAFSVACTLVLDGATGNITSTGSILLSTGGNITSTNNFALTQSAGITIQRGSSGTDFTDAKAINFQNSGTTFASIGGWSNNALALWGGSGASAGVRLGVGNQSSDPANQGLMTTWEETATGGVLNIVAQALQGWSVGTKDDVTIQIVPYINAVSPGVERTQLGTAAVQWDHIYGAQYYTGVTAGWTGNCATTVVVVGGIVTGCV